MNGYYTILSSSHEAETALFKVQLSADADVYRGHFPGDPIAPGVCNLEMIRQLASQMAGRELRFDAIRQCKFLGLIRPDGGVLTVRITLADNKLSATVHSADQLCINLKATVI